MPDRPVTRISYIVKRLEAAVRAQLDVISREYGITTMQYVALSVLYVHPGMSSAELAVRSFVSPQSANQMVAILETSGLIERTHDEVNRRILRIHLTVKGISILESFDSAVDDLESKMMDDIGEAEALLMRHSMNACIRNLTPTISPASETRSGDVPKNAKKTGISEIEIDSRRTEAEKKPSGRRLFYRTLSDQRISALEWGAGAFRLALLHGRGQNAHTWDQVARLLNTSLIALDMPGHGQSDWREDHDYSPRANADVIADVMSKIAPHTEVVVGMSLGGRTAIRLAARYPDLVQRLIVIDTTPGSLDRQTPLSPSQLGGTALLTGPDEFSSLEEMVQAAASATGRTTDSLRNGVLNNARQRRDGTWIWRYDRKRSDTSGTSRERWGDLAAVKVPIMLVIGGKSGRVSDEDVDHFLLLQPNARIERVENSGHSVQSDCPERLTGLIRQFVHETGGSVAVDDSSQI